MAVPICAIGLSVFISVGCAGAVAIEETPTSHATPTPGASQERETVVGRFAIVFGDPPPDSKQPAERRYFLTEPKGRRWRLVFDETVYAPPDGILSYNGKDVEVEGRRTGTDRLLVESIRLR